MIVMVRHLYGVCAGVMLAAILAVAFVGCGGEATADKPATAQADSTKADSAKVAKDNKNAKKVPEGVPVKVRAV